MDYWTEDVTYKNGSAYLGQGFRIKRMYDDHVGVSSAPWTPRPARSTGSTRKICPLWAGMLTTKGGLVFTGTSDGYVKAFDANTGDELWKFQTGSGIISSPITWEMDGEQYIGIQSGYGGAVPLWGGDMAELTKPGLPRRFVLGVQTAQATGCQLRRQVRGGPQAAPAHPGTHTMSRSALLIPLIATALINQASAADTASTDAVETLVINGCPIWPYTRCPGVDLRHADLLGKNLAGADLRGANLTRADLRAANLAGANLEGANLTAARMQKANAPAANFRHATLVGADLEAARLMRSDLSGADLTGASLEFARLNFAWLEGAQLVSANLQEAKFATVNLRGARMEGCVTRFTIFPDADFENCQGYPTGW